MTRIVRAAVTETKNAFADMPRSVAELKQLAGHLEDVRAANVAHHLELLQAAAVAGVQVLGMGELFTAPYFALDENPMWFDLAEDAANGPTVLALREAAREYQMVLVAPIYERAADGRRFNTAVVIDATGEVLGKYRKAHIPQGENEEGAFCEEYYYERSDGMLDRGVGVVAQHFPVFETRVGCLGVAICYDRHFEGVMRSLAAGGAELVFSPAVTFGSKSQRLWELEFEVDAARHGLFIAGSNRRGVEAPWDVGFFGGSHFVGPGGRVAEITVEDELVVVDLDLDELTRADSAGWSLERDVRPGIYEG